MTERRTSSAGRAGPRARGACAHASALARALACAIALTAAVGGARPASPNASALAFGGRIIPADGLPIEGVRVVATDAAGGYEALVDTAGVFVGAFPSEPRGPVTLRVFSDSVAPRYHTSTIALGSGLATAPARIVLVPTQWTIRGGAFAGRQVRIDPARATSRSGDVAGFWRLTRRGRFAGRAVSWAPDSFPVRVAFRHERRDPAISTADSTRFWEQASELEGRLGMSLFRPATFAEVDAGADGILVTVDRGMSAAGRTFITYDPTGRIYEALVSVQQREYLGQSRIATHELLHAIGLGHTASWSSVMGANTGGIDAATPEDIAYAQLYYAISALQRSREAPYGIAEAVPATPGIRLAGVR